MSIQSRPSPLRIFEGDGFIHYTMTERVPNILREVQARNPNYPTTVQHALDALRRDIEEDRPVMMLDPTAPDYAAWGGAYFAQQRIARPFTWLNGEWFFIEFYFYRYLLQTVRWHETARDPFAPQKQVELEGEALWKLLDAALAHPGDLNAMLAYALWGNRADLSFSELAGQDEAADDENLLADDRGAVREHLARTPPGVVHFINDNAGAELAMDLALADLLLAEHSERVVLHVRAHPLFVGDAIAADVWHMLAAMAAYGGAPAELAGRLRSAWEAGRLRLVPHPFWVGPHFVWAMPPPLAQTLRDAQMVIVKGDANYRRVVGDALWDVETPFAPFAAPFGAPVLALRTLKSETVIGVSAETAARLEQNEPDWRTKGRYGVIQFAGMFATQQQEVPQ